MGGDSEPEEVERLSILIHKKFNRDIKTGWYSGRSKLHEKVSIENLDYIKLGPYIENFGGLDNLTTNQRFYEIKNGEMIDKTFLFQQKKYSIY